MGLISGLLGLPLAPVRGVAWLAELLYEQARQELADPAKVRSELAQIDDALAEGEISQEEADQRQEELVNLLWASRESGGGLEV